MVRGTPALWAASTAYSVGQIVWGDNASAPGKIAICTTAGTSGSSQPTWPAANYAGTPATVSDNTVTWTVWTVGMWRLPLILGLLTSTKGPRANSTAYALNDTISLVANDGLVHLYKCTTAGTSAASQSTLYPGAANEAITDGTAVFTEESASLEAGTFSEASYVNYARTAVTPSAANLAATQAAGSTAAVSSGTNGTTSNNGTVNFVAPGAGSATTYVWGIGIFDALTGGNLLRWSPLVTVKTLNAGDAAPSIAAGSYTLQIDN
jgi:hypothetical protein